jgi:uncharacterized membrane protein
MLLNNRTKINLLWTGFAMFLLIFRVLYTKHIFFSFLAWNLFLAWIPLFISQILKNNLSKWKAIEASVAWFLFFPNSMYIITDFIHLKSASSMPYWYDIILISSFSISGLIIGYNSLDKVREFWSKKIKVRYVNIAIGVILFISAYGVYLGRFLRWNSWDALTNPIRLIEDVFNSLAHPFTSPKAWGVTIVYGIFLNLIYSMLYKTNSKQLTD